MPRTTIHDYARDLEELAALAAQPHAVDEVLVRALESLAEIIPYDLAVVYELDGDELRVRASDGPLANERVATHRLPLARFPTIRRALEQRRPLALTDREHQSEEGDPYDGLIDLPHGHSCMVVPLFAADKTLGLITLDRTVCETYAESTVQLAGVYGRLVSLAMLLAGQTRLLSRYRHQLREHTRLLREQVGGDALACQRLEASRSPVMRDLVQKARQVAQADVPVLVQGETGTGKEVIAQAIHAWSPRADAPLVTLNCAALAEGLVESELFGHVKGAFSGAARDRAGRFVTANGGTLLLDEIGDMPLSTQGKLLRVLQEGTFEPVGSDGTVKVDVRVIAASHVDLREAVSAGRFREDLYYRLAIFPLLVPPLRERAEDVFAICEQFLTEASRREDQGPWKLSEDARTALAVYPFPGNVRELRNLLERAIIVRPRGTLQAEDLGLPKAHADVMHPRTNGTSPLTNFPTFRDNERAFLLQALTSTHGKVHGEDGAAALLALKPTTLQSKLKKHGIDLSALRR